MPLNTITAQNASKLSPKMASNKSALRFGPHNSPSSVLRNSPSFRQERELRSAPKFLSVHRQQQCFSQISPIDLSRETTAFSSLIIALKSASPSANAVALPNQSVDLATESFSSFCQERNHALIPNCHGVIFCYANKPVRQPSPSLDSAFPRQSHSCLPSN